MTNPNTPRDGYPKTVGPTRACTTTEDAITVAAMTTAELKRLLDRSTLADEVIEVPMHVLDAQALLARTARQLGKIAGHAS